MTMNEEAQAEEVFLVAVVEMADGHAEAGRRYEDAMAQLIERHGGSVERRMRSLDSQTEVQLIRFKSRAEYESAIVDPDRLDYRDRLGDAAPMTRVIEVHDL